MISITIGTTPTITYTFSLVSPADFASAILTIKRNNNIVIRKELPDAEVGEASVSWTLTQAETLLLGTGQSKMMCNWLTNTGVRGASPETVVQGVTNHIAEVIDGTG